MGTINFILWLQLFYQWIKIIYGFQTQMREAVHPDANGKEQRNDNDFIGTERAIVFRKQNG